MDLSEFLNYYQSFKKPSTKATDLQNNNSIISLSQSKVSNINKKLLQVLSPSEETLKTCLYSDQHKTNNDTDSDQSTDSLNSVNLNLYRFQFKNIRRFQLKKSELDFMKTYDMASDSIYSDGLDQIVYKIVYHNNLSLTSSDLDDYRNSETLYSQLYDDYRALQPNQHFPYNDYVKMRANNLLLARLGYKLTLKLNTDNNKPETWYPNVAQTILSVDYSSFSLVKDCSAAQVPLDRFEPFLLEVVNAFQDAEPIDLPDFAIKFKSDPSPAKFVSICMKLKSLKKLCDNDKIVLISSSFYDVFCMNAVVKYNQSTDEWIFPESWDSRFGRRDLFFWNRLLHDMTVSVIESFPDRWRKDEVVEALISLIIILNPDQVGLMFADSVRHEQYIYIYLLKRYLDSVCESPCDASDNLYRLMVGVEKFRELGEITCKHTNEFVTGYHRSLQNLIIDAINNK